MGEKVAESDGGGAEEGWEAEAGDGEGDVEGGVSGKEEEAAASFEVAALLSTVATTSESKVIKPCPTITVSSALARRDVTVPAKGDRISIETLSVSMTATISSVSTDCPGSFRNSTRVPSEIESPSDGTGNECVAKAREQRRAIKREVKVVIIIFFE